MLRTGAIWAAGLLLAAVVAGAVWVRTAPLPPDRHHLDPVDAPAPSTPNHHRLLPAGSALPGPGITQAPVWAPVWAMTAEALMAEFDRVAMASPRVTRLAGSVDAGHVTYVARSRIWGFPDLVSVRSIALPEAEDGPRATLAAFSRARFGQSDLGVNRARMEAWIAALPPATE